MKFGRICELMRLTYHQVIEKLNNYKNPLKLCENLERNAVDNWRLKYGNNSNLNVLQDKIKKYYPKE